MFYLTRKSVHELIHRVGGLAAPGSGLGLDMMNWNLMFSPVTWPQLGALANRGARGRFGTNMPEDFMRDHGWVANAIQPGDEGANYGRLPTPTSRNLPGIPRSFFVTATRTFISK